MFWLALFAGATVVLALFCGGCWGALRKAKTDKRGIIDSNEAAELWLLAILTTGGTVFALIMTLHHAFQLLGYME